MAETQGGSVHESPTGEAGRAPRAAYVSLLRHAPHGGQVKDVRHRGSTMWRERPPGFH
jgi:hypothetical protein